MVDHTDDERSEMPEPEDKREYAGDLVQHVREYLTDTHGQLVPNDVILEMIQYLMILLRSAMYPQELSYVMHVLLANTEANLENDKIFIDPDTGMAVPAPKAEDWRPMGTAGRDAMLELKVPDDISGLEDL